MANQSGGFKLLKGLVIGGIIGSAVGILFAPNSGKKTRKKLMNEADRLKNELEKYANDFSEKAKQAKQDLEDKLAEVTSKIEKSAENLKHTVRKETEKANGQKVS